MKALLLLAAIAFIALASAYTVERDQRQEQNVKQLIATQERMKDQMPFGRFHQRRESRKRFNR
jgi:hypothetical protein